MTTATTEANHALDNAAAWNGTISAAYEAFTFCQEQTDGRDLTREAKALLYEHSFDGTNHDDVACSIEEENRDAALSVEVRSCWVSPGTDPEPGEYCVLLTTGGPALRIHGDLDAYAEPCSHRLQYQDWGTPWTEYLDADMDALRWFAGLFHMDFA